MTLSLTLNLNQEQQDAWDARRHAYNTVSGTNLTTVQYIEQVWLSEKTERLVKAKFDAAATRITEATRNMPYAARLALIEQIESSIA